MKKNHVLNKVMKKVSKYKRIYFVAAFFVIFFLIIVQKLFSNTVVNHEFYQNLADRQQIGKITVPVTRGTVYSATNNGTILWTSLNLYDIAIDPQVEWSKEKLQLFLTDVVYKETCENQTAKECYRGLVKFLRVLEIEDLDYSEENIKNLISEYLQKKIYQKYVTSVFIDKELEQEKIDKIQALWFAGVYPTFPFLYINPEEIVQRETIISTLAPIIWIEEDRFEHTIRKRKIQYVSILNKLSIWVSEYVKEFSKEEKIALKRWILEKENSISGFLLLNPRPHRYYPEKNVGSQIIGFVDSEGKWHYWLEWYFNDSLKWNKGKKISRKDIKWREIETISLDDEDDNTEWVKIYTTIDRSIQKKVETILEDWVKKYRANKWTVVVMEPKTGRVLAMANYPTYNLNNYSDVYELEKVRFSKYPNPSNDLLWYTVFKEDTENGERYFYDNKEIYLTRITREELWDNLLVKYKYKNDFWPWVYQNDAISALYEPGSIMKSLVFAMWIDTGEIDANELYYDPNKLEIAGFPITNLDKKRCGWLHSFSNALDFSCNVWMVRIVQRLGTLITYNYFKKYWFDQVTWITLEWEVSANMKDWQKWSKSHLYTSSYWLGISVTPLQMAAAYSVLANGWVYKTPKIIEKVEFADGKVIEYKSESERRVLKESTSQVMTKILVNWVKNWAAKNWYVDWFNLAGKTGTAQISYKGKYCDANDCSGKTRASFAWYGPAEDPKFVIIVKLERPRSNQYGWSTSAYLFSEISEYLLDVYNIPKKVKK
jgi:stage V sporulation protein D (sporulation-specific penicillin-binding protein)